MSKVFKTKIALLSVYDKSGLDELARGLVQERYTLVASGGTAEYLREKGFNVNDVSHLTGVSGMLGGRVKTLHPAIHAGILARSTPSDLADLYSRRISPINVVVCNMYPLDLSRTNEVATSESVIDGIDIGGSALLRSAAKNYERVTVLCDTSDYAEILKEMQDTEGISIKTRERLALKAFSCTAQYDDLIADYYRKTFLMGESQITLRYGMNSHQSPAQAFLTDETLPFSVLNGSPSFINLCDALTGWQIVKELKEALDLPAAASMKHLTPAGAAVGIPLSKEEGQVLMEDNMNKLSPLAVAYARARGADRTSSYGDFIALSHSCDEETAEIIKKEVSDGVIAPGFSDTALEILRQKKSGSYCVIKIDPEFQPKATERRTVFGVTLEQQRNASMITKESFSNVVSKKKELPDDAVRDLIIASVAVKYAISNAVCFARSGQVIGIGAGQQSRIHSTLVAAKKAKNWWLRHHLKIRAINFKENVKRNRRDNLIQDFIQGKMLLSETFSDVLEDFPEALTEDDKSEWCEQLSGTCLASDSFFSFQDNIYWAKKCGVEYIFSPSGSVNDGKIIEACDSEDIVLIHTDIRMFNH